jgi:hypothetical protein
MGNPAVIFTTYGNSSSFATTNVSGHGSGNSTHSPFIELKSDAVPQAAKFSNGDFTVTDFDTLRSTGLTATEYANGDLTGGTHRNTTYSTRGTLGTFSLGGGQFELCEFDTGAKGSSIANHVSKSGVSHDYIAFANTGDGDGLLRNVQGTLTVPATNAKGPPTAYAPGKPFANIEYDVSHTSTPLQAIAGGGTDESDVSGVFIASRNETEIGGDTVYTWTINNVGARTEDTVIRTTNINVTVGSGDDASIQSTAHSNATNLILEDWFPGQSHSKSTDSAAIHRGTIKFKVHPDSEYVMTETMTTTNVAVASVTIAPSSDVGPIATHSKVTVTTSAVHGLTDDQNQIVLTGSDNPTHINGIHNVYSVTSTTVFTYEIIKSTVPSGETCEGTFRLQTYDGIDKTGAVIKTSADASATGIAEVVHGGCGGNNTVLLRGDTSSNISLGTQYYVHSTNTTSTSIAPVKFTEGPTYKSMFREMGLELDQDTGQISSNGVFNGNDSGVKELDSYFPKFKHARDYALNRIKNDGTITQTGDVVTIQGVDAVSNIILLEDESGISTEGGFFTIGLETGSQTFPSEFAEALPPVARYKTLQYQNGFTTNVSYASSNSEFVVQSNAEITLSTDTADGETYELTYADTSWPVTNSSSYWFLDNIENSPVVDDQSNILIFKTTSEGTNFKVHFTIQAQKVHEQMDVYAGGAGTSTAASVLNTIDGWGDFELGTGNYKDGFFFTSVYNNTDSDRDDQVIVFSDQNNASTTTLDFNGNAFKHRDDPDDPDTEVAILNKEALANGYSNGDFTLLTSV